MPSATPYNLQLQFSVSFVNDSELERYKRSRSVDNHVVGDDYFATLATVLDLLRQQLEKEPTNRDVSVSTAKHLGDIRDDLLYSQKHYTIASRK